MPSKRSDSELDDAAARRERPLKVRARAADILAAMLAYRSGQRPGTIMDRIAKGFTDDEIKAIADWYGAQKD